MSNGKTAPKIIGSDDKDIRDNFSSVSAPRAPYAKRTMKDYDLQAARATGRTDEFAKEDASKAPAPRRPVILCDLDNCVADDRDRITLIDWTKTDPDERYRVYHEAASNDPADFAWLYNYILPLTNMETHPRIFFLTARPTEFAQATEDWLAVNFGPKGVAWEATIHRNPQDHRSSAEVKSTQLDWLLIHYDVQLADIVFAFDDRADVIEMYRGFGIGSAKVQAIHDRCAWTPPQPAISRARTAGATPASVRASDILRLAAKTYEERNAVYGDNYKNVGHVMKALFPGGVKLDSPDDFAIWHLFELIVVKLTRFANSNLTHQDSIHDATVYAAMVESMLGGQK